MNGPWLYRFGTEKYHDYKINKPEYKAENGHWDILDVPEEYRHQHHPRGAAAHRQGAAGRRVGQQPEELRREEVRHPAVGPGRRTPSRRSPRPRTCSAPGHTQLANGNLLIAGGTKRYEKLKGDVTKAGGLMIVHNENPDKPITLPRAPSSPARRTARRSSPRTRSSSSGRRRSSTRRPAQFLRNDPGLGRIYVEAQKSGTQVRDGHPGQLPHPGPDRRRRPQHLRHRAEARPRQEGLPGDQGRLRVRPGRREVHQGRPDERGPLVSDADHASSDGKVLSRLRPRRHRAAGARARTRSTTRRPRSGRTPARSGSSRPTRRSS